MQKIVICNTIETVEKYQSQYFITWIMPEYGFSLTYIFPFLPYRNQSTDLLCKSMNWFLCGKFGKKWARQNPYSGIFYAVFDKNVFFTAYWSMRIWQLKNTVSFFLLLIIRLFIDRDFHCQLFILKMVKGKLDICRKNCQAINWETNCFEKGMSTLAKKQFAEQKGCFGRILPYWYFDSPSFYPEVQVKNKTTLYLNLLQ